VPPFDALAWPLHMACTSSHFTVPKHGSPNVPLSTRTAQDDLPTHASETIDDALEASQNPFWKLPQEPTGVP
jgi:hypothetical protein